MKTILFLLLTSLLLSADPIPAFSRQPYLQLATHQSINIVWRTQNDIQPRLVYGTTQDELSLNAQQIITRTHPSLKKENPLFKDAPVQTQQFEATLTQLQPATKYYYAIYDDQTRLTPADESYHFKTNPLPGSEVPVYFWIVGDSGTGSKAQAQVHQAMVDHTTAQNRPLDLYLHVGDMAYGSGTNQEFSDRFFKMYEPTPTLMI